MPKVKIVEVHYRYCDSCGDIYDYTQSDLDEVTEEELLLLEEWAAESQRGETDHYYIIAVLSDLTPAIAIKEYVERLKKKKENKEKAKKIRDEKRKERAVKEAEKQRQQELATLEKLQKKYKK